MTTQTGSAPLAELVSASRRILGRASRGIGRMFACVMAITLIGSAAAQAPATGTIQGRIQNSDTATYLNNARVRVVGTAREAFTNEFGEYRLSGLPAGEAKLDVFYTGMPPKQVTVTVPVAGVVEQNIELSAEEGTGVVKLNQFVVQSEREMSAAAIAINEQRFAATRKDVVSTDAFGEINQGNIGEFVKFLPGISLDVKDGNTPSGIMIRGFDPNYTNVTMDGGQLASTLIANTQTSSRQFVLEGMNINNIARIEVTKLPTPDMSANLLGGAVNFVSKSAFERVRPEIRMSAYLSANEKTLDFKQTPGPFDAETYKVRPSFDFQYVNPVSKRFGFVVTAQHSSQFYLQNKSVIGYRFTSAGATPANPYITNVNTSYAPNRSDRTGGGLTVDMKPWDHNVIKINLQASAQKQQSASRALNYNVGGTQPVSWDQHNTYGAATGGSVGISTSFQERHALTRSVGATWEFDRENWLVEAGVNYSNANNRTRDLDKGFFRNVSVTLPNVRTVNLINVDSTQGSMGDVQVFGPSGRINELKLANWNLTAANPGMEPANNVDDVSQARLNLTRRLTIFRTPVALKFGGDVLDSKRDQEYNPIAFTYVGPDGIANSGDEGLGNYVSPADFNVSPGFGRPAPEWPDPFALSRDFNMHRNWWTQTPSQQGDTVRNIAIRSPWFHERITSGFVMGDVKLFKSRLRLVAGVRYELTEDEGQGYRQNGDAVYVHDAQGKIVYTTNSNGMKTSTIRPELLPSGSAAYNAVLYTKRGYYNSRDYHYYHPSIAGTYNLTENILLRAAFAKTIGRPNLSDIVPNLFVGENANFGVPGQSNSSIPGFITGANTGLKPWTAKNYDYTAEYYLPKGGMVMFNAYRKDIRNFFSTINQIADQALLDQLGLDSSALGYQYSRRVNVADARIQGWEANVELPLSNLTEWGRFTSPIGRSWVRHFSLRYNETHLDLSGSRITSADWKRYIPRARNFGVQWRFPKFSGSVLVNWKGRMLRDTNSSFPGANEYIRSRYQVDVSAEYQLTKHFSTFFAARNLLNSPTEWEVSGPGVARWATMTNLEDYGAQYTLGVRAVF